MQTYVDMPDGTVKKVRVRSFKRPSPKREPHPVRVYSLPDADRAALIENARLAGIRVPSPTTTDMGFGNTRLNILKMRDNTHYAIYTDGSFRRLPKRRRFQVDGRVLSGRQLRMVRKNARRTLKREQASGA